MTTRGLFKKNYHFVSKCLIGKLFRNYTMKPSYYLRIDHALQYQKTLLYQIKGSKMHQVSDIFIRNQ